MVWVDCTGGEEAIAAPFRPYDSPRLSPDGTRLIVYANDAEKDSWVWDFARATLMRLTTTPATESLAVWSPDARQVVYSSDYRALLSRAADGTGAVSRLLEGTWSAVQHLARTGPGSSS